MTDDKPRRARRVPPPLDGETLGALAIRYVARYATTEAKLRRYLQRKIDARGFIVDAPPPIDAIVARAVTAGFVDDAVFAEQRASALRRSGYGHRRVRDALTAAGVARDTVTALMPDDDAARAAAERYAQRRRLGRFAVTAPDAALHRKHLAAMIRAGHDYAIARRVLLGD